MLLIEDILKSEILIKQLVYLLNRLLPPTADEGEVTEALTGLV